MAGSFVFCMRPLGHTGPCINYLGANPDGRVWARNEQDEETIKEWRGFLDSEIALKPKKKWRRKK